jgi:hypothetical protein
VRGAVYNSAIPKAILNPVNRVSRPARSRLAQLLFVIFATAVASHAADWSAPEQQLARKIVAVTGPGAVALTIENRSSLGRREQEVAENGLRSALEGLGLRFVQAEQAAATVRVSLSENVGSYVWVAEIHQSAGEDAVTLVSIPRTEGSTTARDSVPLSLRKTPLWSQDDRILDVAVLEESAAPTHIAVLEAEKVSLYRLQGTKWQQEQALEIAHSRPWPRDLRGRLVPARDHLLDVYLPGVICRSTAVLPLTLTCRESDDPWPLVSGALSGNITSVFPRVGSGNNANGSAAIIPQTKAFFAPTRNFFTGVLAPSLGKFTTVPKFYSAAVLPRDKYSLWLFAATDSQVHLIDGVSDQAAKLGWGSDLTSVRTSCGAGWQVLAAASIDDGQDSVRIYEFPDRDPVVVSAAVDLPGTITALWTEARGDTAVVVVRNRETGSYEAFRLGLACDQ